MPEISRFLGIVIRMYPRDHLPPHFHACYGDEEALITLGPVTQLQGRLPPRVLALIVEWALRHQAELFANWDSLREGLPARPIAPLE